MRARGRQLGAALASSKADVTVLFTFAHSAAARELEGGLPAARASFGLLPAFVDGMMDGAGQAEFVDGYEAAYGFKAHSEFVEGARHIRRQGRQTSLDRRRYARRMKVGFGIWPVGREVDERQPMADQPFSFTPEDLEHATHYAFRESDGLVWLYTGGLRRWWERLPEAYVAAVRDAWKPHPLDRRPPAKAGSALYSLSARGRADVKDADVFQHLKDRYIEVLGLPLRWEFRLDPEDAGRRQEWFRPGSRGGWKPIEIREWWQPQGYMVSGLAWYRVEVDVPPLASTKGVILAFGAVDEQAWVWVNGQFAGEHAFGPEGWQSPFEIEVGRLLRPGRRNLIAVRVHDSAGVGGIWKGVKIMAPR